MLTQPATPLCGPPALTHAVLSLSKPNWTWWVGKQVLISVYFCVFGSYISSWRPDVAIGKTFADG